MFCLPVPENPPVNVTAVLNGTEVLMTWEGPPGKLNGELQGYVVEYSTPAAQEVTSGTMAGSTRAAGHMCEGQLILTSEPFSVSSFLWTLVWTPSCQSTCPRRCPMCLSEFVPTPGQEGGPGRPPRH